MRLSFVITLCISIGCRPAAPVTPADVASDEPATGDESPAGVVSLRPDGERSDTGEAARTSPPLRANGIVDELVETINAALAGRELPTTTFRLPGSRGEQVLRLQSDGFPQGTLAVVASMLKVDVTLNGCEPNGGLTLGVVQSASGVHIVGLGDQFSAAEGPTPEPRGEVVALSEHIMEEIAHGNGRELLLDDALCESDFGSVDHCRRMFQEIPSEVTLTRYEQMLSSCEASPVYALTVVGLWLRDDAGVAYQAIVRMGTRGASTIVTEPILLGSGPR